MFTVKNSGDAATGELDYSLLVDAGPGDFRVIDDQCFSVVLGVGDECTIEVDHENVAGGGTTTGSLEVTASPGGERSASLTGHGLPGGLVVDPSPGEVVDTPDAFGVTPFVVWNTSGVATSVAVSLVEVDGPGNFDVAYEDCSAAPLASGELCEVDVLYEDESESGGGVATLRIVGSGLGAFDTPITGEMGDEPLDLDHRSASLTDTPGPGLSAPATFVITNDSSDASGELAVNLLHEYGDGLFSLDNDTCDGEALQPAATCSVDVRYSNQRGSGSRSVTLVVEDTSGEGGFVLALIEGNGLPGFHIFEGTMAVTDDAEVADGEGWVRVTQRSSTASGPISVEIVETTGTGSFELHPFFSTDCGTQSLAPSGYCDVRIRYRNNTGTGSGTARVRISAPGQSSEEVTFLGRGQVPNALALSETDLDFVDTPTGTGTVHTVTFTNVSASSVWIQRFAVPQGPSVGTFHQLSEDCSSSLTLAPGQSCSVTYQYENNTGSGVAAMTYMYAFPLIPGEFSLVRFEAKGLP